MPPKGGAALSEADIDALAAYVWSMGRKKTAGELVYAPLCAMPPCPWRNRDQARLDATNCRVLRS